MKLIYKALACTVFVVISSSAQTEQQKSELIRELNTSRVTQTNSILKKLYYKRQERIQEYLGEKKIKDRDYIHKIYDVINGEPVIRVTENEKASKFTKTSSIQPNGNLGLSLEGENYDVGIWDENATMIEHVEFGNTGNSRVSKGDNAFGYSGHATHVAGTIAAEGIRPEAKGMAPKASIKTYDWNSDDIEASEAASQGLLISNHSYGIPVFEGDTQISSARRVGAYTENAYIWDLLPYTYQYYLPIVSAGNDGGSENSNPIQPTYDKLMGNKTSKNLIIVANSTDTFYGADGNYSIDPFINSSSSEGPTDDGRVKPDIAGMGTGLISSYFITEDANTNDNYARSTGTSMSAPNVAGTLILLQELHYNTHNSFLKNYELKNLIIHTAYDPSTTSTGPDPIYGWGVLNAESSAKMIIDKNSGEIIFDQLTLNEGNTIEINISLLQDRDFTASIVWNDVPGLGSPDNYQGDFGLANDPTPSLINDLDIRLKENSTTTEYLPWKLDMSQASISAVKMDNNVDNVEKIEMDQLPAGNYTMTISHKNNLVNGLQDFSLIITGIDDHGTLSNTDFESKNISFWPNPVKSNLNISSSDISFSNEVEVSIYDMVGRKVIDKKDFSSTSNLSIDTSTLSEGIYILKLTDGAQSIQKRIIKE